MQNVVQEKESPRLSYSTRINLYCLTVLVLSANLLYSYSSDALLRADAVARLQNVGIIQPHVAPSADFSNEMKSDPPLGMALSDGQIGSRVRRIAGADEPATLLVFVGDCAGCLPMDIRFYTEMARKAPVSLVLISNADEKNTATFIKDVKAASEVDVVAGGDPGNQVLSSLNPVFRPRAYLFDKNWKLRWKQTNAGLGYTPFTDDVFKSRLSRLRSNQ